MQDTEENRWLLLDMARAMGDYGYDEMWWADVYEPDDLEYSAPDLHEAFIHSADYDPDAHWVRPLVEVRRFTIEKVIKLVEGILRGVLIPTWLRLRVLFFLFLLYQLVYPALLVTVLPRERPIALK